MLTETVYDQIHGWLRSTVVERRSLAGELILSYARPAAEGRPLMWVNRPLQVSQLSLSSFWGRYMSSKLYYRMCVTPLRWHHLVNAYGVMASCG